MIYIIVCINISVSYIPDIKISRLLKRYGMFGLSVNYNYNLCFIIIIPIFYVDGLCRSSLLSSKERKSIGLFSITLQKQFLVSQS